MTGFAGLERDTVTGLNLAVFRAQNPATGRWTSEDPLRFAAGDADLYRYVRNNATSLGDPSGLGPLWGGFAHPTEFDKPNRFQRWYVLRRGWRGSEEGPGEIAREGAEGA